MDNSLSVPSFISHFSFVYVLQCVYDDIKEEQVMGAGASLTMVFRTLLKITM